MPGLLRHFVPRNDGFPFRHSAITLRSDAESTRRMDSASCDFAQDDAPDGSAQNDARVPMRRRDACALVFGLLLDKIWC